MLMHVQLPLTPVQENTSKYTIHNLNNIFHLFSHCNCFLSSLTSFLFLLTWIKIFLIKGIQLLHIFMTNIVLTLVGWHIIEKSVNSWTIGMTDVGYWLESAVLEYPVCVFGPRELEVLLMIFNLNHTESWSLSSYRLDLYSSFSFRTNMEV